MNRRTASLFGIAVVAGVMITPGYAFAARPGKSHHAAPATPHHAPTTRKPTSAPAKPAPAAVQHFTVDGLIVGGNSTTLKVLTSRLLVGTTTLPNRVVTVVRPATPQTRDPVAAPVPAIATVGYWVLVSGDASASGSSLVLTGRQEATQPRPASVFLGAVTGVDGTRAQVAELTAADGDRCGDERHTLTVEMSTATVTVDGAAGQLVAGQFVVVLGERNDDTVLASTVTASSTAPSVVSGEITTVTGSVVTVDAGRNLVSVDLAPNAVAVPVLLNGTDSVDPSTLTAGDKIVVLGTRDGTTFTPSTAFVFNGHDTAPAGNNHDTHGHNSHGHDGNHDD